MKLKRIATSLVSALLLLTPASVKAQIPDEVKQKMTPEQIADFFICINPKKDIDRAKLIKTIEKAYNAPKSNSSKGGASTYDALDDLNAALGNITVMNPADVYFTMTQLLPLYTYTTENRVTPRQADMTNVEVEEVFRAPADGAYFGYGDSRNYYKPYGLSAAEQEQVLKDGGKIKRSGSYVWGMTHHNGKLYWSTNTNYMCIPGYATVASAGDMSWSTKGTDNGCWECEYQKGARKGESVKLADGTTAYLGIYADIMVPRIFCYDPQTGVTEDITPKEGTEAYEVLRNCQGLRSAYTFKDIIFFGGPGLVGGTSTAATSSAFVAYDPATGEYIGSSDMSNIEGCKVTNVRRWVEVDGVLYCGVGITDTKGVAKGAVLRWYGDRSNPFEFRIVAWTPCEAAEIEKHNGRLYVGGWPVTTLEPNGNQTYPYAEIYKSPIIPDGGFTPADAKEWESIWRFQKYWDRSAYVSSLRSYNGKLYWGMFGSTFGGFYTAKRAYPNNPSSPQAIAYMLGNLSSTTVWRYNDRHNDIELLYGEEKVPHNYSSLEKPYWDLKPNGMNLKPKWGRSGWGNLFTSYTWSLCKYKGQLMFGTMDMGDLIDAAMGSSSAEDAQTLSTVKQLLNVNESEYGYELVALSDPEKEPKYMTSNGFGNPWAYGIRNLEVIGHDLYIGTANPFNIADKGGWQIMRMRDNDRLNISDDDTPTGINNTAELPAANILMKRMEGHVVFYTANGEDIESVTVADVAGRQLVCEKGQNNVAYVFTNGMENSVVIATVKTKSGTWTTKLSIK